MPRKAGSNAVSKIKVNIRDCYRDLIDDQEEEDEMGDWAMSLNEKEISKQRQQRVQPFFQTGRRRVRRGGNAMAFRFNLFTQHMEDADQYLKYGLTTAGGERAGMMREAIRSYRLAEERWPAAASLLINRCIAHEELGNLWEAAVDAERAVELEPENAKALYRLARTSRLVGDAMKADLLYKKCFELSCAIKVWNEMTESRLDYLMQSEGCTAEEVDEAHVLADSLTEASLFVRAMRDRTAELPAEDNPAGSPDQITRKMQLSLSATSDFIMLDLEEQVKKFNSFLTPSNIFQSRGVFLYDCSCKDNVQIRNAFRKCGAIASVAIRDDYVSIMFPDVRSAITAISLMAGALSSGLTDEDTPLTVRFAPSSKSMEDMIRICIREEQCLGWRTTGCHLRKLCKFRHLEADFRVDLHPFMQQVTSPFQQAAVKQHGKYQQMYEETRPVIDKKPVGLVLHAR